MARVMVKHITGDKYLIKMQLSQKASKNIPPNLYIRRMISKQRHVVWTMLAAFLLVIAHDLTPHSHSFEAHMPTIFSEKPHTTGGGILETLIELDLGVDHLEHFSPASELAIAKIHKQVAERSSCIQPSQELTLVDFSGAFPYLEEPVFHSVFPSPQCLFRGPPVLEA